MNYLVKDQPLVLRHEPNKGAWTYHIQLPNTKHLTGKWGTLKVAGFIDEYPIESINLFTISGQDKLISINAKIRKALNKSGGDTVNVTLYLLKNSEEQISQNEILETFKDAGVSQAFTNLSEIERNKIITTITSSKSANKQTEIILKFIEQLINSQS